MSLHRTTACAIPDEPVGDEPLSAQPHPADVASGHARSHDVQVTPRPRRAPGSSSASPTAAISTPADGIAPIPARSNTRAQQLPRTPPLGPRHPPPRAAHRQAPASYHPSPSNPKLSSIGGQRPWIGSVLDDCRRYWATTDQCLGEHPSFRSRRIGTTLRHDRNLPGGSTHLDNPPARPRTPRLALVHPRQPLFNCAVAAAEQRLQHLDGARRIDRTTVRRCSLDAIDPRRSRCNSEIRRRD